MTMETIPFTQFRSHLAQTLEAVDRGSDTCVISRRGRPAGVLMSYESYLGLTQGQRGFAARLAQWRQVAQPVLGGCRAWGAESENRPQRGQFLPDLQAHSPAMGQEDGKKWTAAAGFQPAIPKSDSLPEATAAEEEPFTDDLRDREVRERPDPWAA